VPKRKRNQARLNDETNQTSLESRPELASPQKTSPHGLADTHKDQLNADLLAFLKT